MLSNRTSAHSEDGMFKFIDMCKDNNCTSILDIGSGQGYHAQVMRNKGLKVSTTDIKGVVTYRGDYNKLDIPQHDGIFCAHVLEHQLNVNSFLKKVFSDLKEGGILCITVPPLKHKIVGGHVTLWNAGLVIYNLVLAGFDCSKASIKTYGYNISVILKKKSRPQVKLIYDNGDLLTINKYLPVGLIYSSSGAFDGNIAEYNW